ncbi:Putative protein ENSP00000358542 [Fukomys damarensis]|uniref:Small integral membrane protein 9 n=2 Tax=Fukomys damarensis TaxID=885580 RepID=A0A091DP47_FUKDA|nr:Putative protein ENSP00000358542 [Fukomys damarensis]
MEPLKLFCIAFLLCSLTCFLLEAEASPPSRLLGFGMQDKSGWKPRSRGVFAIRMIDPIFEKRKIHVSGNQKSWLSNFRAYLDELFRNTTFPAAIVAIFLNLSLMGTLCCLT